MVNMQKFYVHSKASQSQVSFNTGLSGCQKNENLSDKTRTKKLLRE